MGLMTGTGPFGKKPAGTFNFEPPAPGKALFLDPSPKRVRAVIGGETIADSTDAYLLHESGLQPVYYFPSRDVRSEFLEPSDRVTRCPKKGEASYWSVRVGERFEEAVAWYYPDPLPEAAWLEGLVAFYFDRVDHWYEEDEEVFVHPRDPYHRVDVRSSTRTIRVSLDSVVLAETSRAMALFETNLPVRWYMPREDVVASLAPSSTVTRCPYKGTASYYSVEGVSEGDDLIWYYDEPFDEVRRIEGLLCFYNERVDIEIDGEAVERPGDSPFARKPRSEAPVSS
jgi:uncharacterized protein (DUF427 family)